MDRERFAARAVELGAEHAVVFTVDQLEFDPRTILKCMFGCGDWGKGLTCPSRAGALKPWEYEQILRRYAWGVLVHTHDQRMSQQISLKLESEAFVQGHHFAFSFSDCALCAECAGFKGRECVNPKKARPAFHSVGIDVFRTVHKFGLPLKTLASEDEEQNWYSAVFVE